MAGKKIIDDPKRAWRRARATVSDIAMYNESKIREGIENDNLFDILAEEIDQGRKEFATRVAPELVSQGIFERCLVDKLFKPQGHIASKIW